MPVVIIMTSDRLMRQYVSDSSDIVHPLDCVPEERGKKSWTRGVKAWDKRSGEDVCVGWFLAPRKKGKKTLYTKKRNSVHNMAMTLDKVNSVKVINSKKEWRKAWADPSNRQAMLKAKNEGSEFSVEELANLYPDADNDGGGNISLQDVDAMFSSHEEE